MRFSIMRAITVMALATLAGGVPAMSHGGMLNAAPAAASGQQTCSGPMLGGTITGPLLVTGDCELDGVTVNGSITITPGSELDLYLGTVVNGSITGTRAALYSEDSRVVGSISLTGGTLLNGSTTSRLTSTVSPKVIPFNLLAISNNSKVGGSTTVNGGLVAICTSTLGSVSLTNTQFLVGGDFDDGFALGIFNISGCGKDSSVTTAATVCSSPRGAIIVCGLGNYLGSLTVANSFGEIENNFVYGSVGIAHSMIDLSSNEVLGSAQCLHDTKLDDGDNFGNLVNGADTCENLPPSGP